MLSSGDRAFDLLTLEELSAVACANAPEEDVEADRACGVEQSVVQAAYAGGEKRLMKLVQASDGESGCDCQRRGEGGEPAAGDPGKGLRRFVPGVAEDQADQPIADQGRSLHR